MIGGNDIIINARPTLALKEFIRRYLVAMWPLLVVDDETGEWFAFKDAAARESIVVNGVTDENDDSMINVIFGKDRFTMVVASVVGSRTVAMARELEQNIKANFHVFELT